MQGHTDKATINQRRPLTANMLNAMRLMSDRPLPDRGLSTATENAIRALIARGLIDWRIEDRTYSLSAAGRDAIIQQIKQEGRMSDWIIRGAHPFDDGYWARYDGKPRPRGRVQRQGWDTCNRELRDEQSGKTT